MSNQLKDIALTAFNKFYSLTDTDYEALYDGEGDEKKLNVEKAEKYFEDKQFSTRKGIVDRKYGEATKKANEAWEAKLSEVSGGTRPEDVKGVDWLSQYLDNSTKANEAKLTAYQTEKEREFNEKYESLKREGVTEEDIKRSPLFSDLQSKNSKSIESLETLNKELEAFKVLKTNEVEAFKVQHSRVNAARQSIFEKVNNTNFALKEADSAVFNELVARRFKELMQNVEILDNGELRRNDELWTAPNDITYKVEHLYDMTVKDMKVLQQGEPITASSSNPATTPPSNAKGYPYKGKVYKSFMDVASDPNLSKEEQNNILLQIKK